MAALKQQLVINDDDHTVPSKSAPQRKLYWQRFWLAAVFSCWGLIQSAMWNFYSPIQQEVKQVRHIETCNGMRTASASTK